MAQGKLEASDSKAGERGLHPVHNPGALTHQNLTLAVWSASVLFLNCRDRSHAAMPRLAPKPAQKGTLQKFGVEPIGFRPPVFARHRDTIRVDNVSFDVACPQPPRQPETIAPGLVGNHNPLNRMPRLDRLVSPAPQKLE